MRRRRKDLQQSVFLHVLQLGAKLAIPYAVYSHHVDGEMCAAYGELGDTVGVVLPDPHHKMVPIP